MSEMVILKEAELRKLVGLNREAVACIEDAFHALATKSVAMPPILRLDVPEHNGEVDIKTAYVPGLDGFAIKISPGFFDNPKLGIPSLNGMMVLLSSHTGLVEALLLDNGYLTAVRTAAAGAVAAKHLAREDATVLTVFGTGEQAALQVEAVTLVRTIQAVRVWGRDAAKAERLAQSLAGRLRIPAQAETDPEAAVRGAHIIVTATPATAPILRADWLEPGQHVTAMGSDAEHKNELEPLVVVKADAYVADSLKQTRRLGELHHSIAAGLVKAEAVFTELGEIVAGLKPGRPGPHAITVADLTGTGIQDTAIANLARDRAQRAKAGTTFVS